jgi:ATP-binding cassette subfamily F protein 3
LQINRNEKIAFVGPNGAGKTTLAKIIAGQIDFDSGKRNLGYNTTISYYAQDVADNMQPDIDLLETVDGIAEDKTMGELRSILGAFLFSGDDVFKKVKVLSGGEKSRLALAKILLTKSNFIVLDEPTNHLDMTSKRVLQQALINFNGSLILVSHDVDFLKPIVDKVIEIRKGAIKIFNGGIDYYFYKKNELANSEAEQYPKSETILIKKQQKRIEAERRQERYKATKHLIEKISVIEKEIELLEKKEKALESSLADPQTYQDQQKALELNKEFNELKLTISGNLKTWGKLSEELQKIEAKFK